MTNFTMGKAKSDFKSMYHNYHDKKSVPEHELPKNDENNITSK